MKARQHTDEDKLSRQHEAPQSSRVKFTTYVTFSADPKDLFFQFLEDIKKQK